MIRDTLARPLFTSDHDEPALERRAETGNSFPIYGLLVFAFILSVAIFFPVVSYDSNYDFMTGFNSLIHKDVPLFFSSHPMNNYTLPEWADYRGELIMGVINARLFSLIMGIFLSFMTYFFVYYNSAIPGEIPRSPLFPQRNKLRYQHTSYSIAISYKMVPVNGVIFGLIIMIFLRLYLNVPF